VGTSLSILAIALGAGEQSSACTIAHKEILADDRQGDVSLEQRKVCSVWREVKGITIDCLIGHQFLMHLLRVGVGVVVRYGCPHQGADPHPQGPIKLVKKVCISWLIVDRFYDHSRHFTTGQRLYTASVDRCARDGV
jgi:hypothetical protein